MQHNSGALRNFPLHLLTRDGAIWRDTSILRILDESNAKGVYVFNTMRQTGTWRTETKPESEWGRAECPLIVAESLWNHVNQIIEEQLKSWKKPGKVPVHLFSGLAHCACGHKMYVAAKSPKYFCRKCCSKIPVTGLENIVRDELKLFFGQHDRVSRHLEEAGRNLAEKTDLLEGRGEGELHSYSLRLAGSRRDPCSFGPAHRP